jgi:hydroxyacylglutathione hydrolase
VGHVPERVLLRPPWSPTLERVAPGVWLLRGDLRRAMNVYLLEGDGAVTAFDSGTRPMAAAVRAAAARLGGLERVVLGHADSDHRGTAPALGVPVLCHPDEVAAARAPGPFRDYWDISLIEVPHVRWLYRHYLHRRWDGGPVEVARTLAEGDELCGFRVVDFPGHAPGLIGLWRADDALAIVSDTVYFVDSARLRPLPAVERAGVSGLEASVPHRAWNWSTERAAESVRKLASLRPRKVLAGHADPLEGDPEGIAELLLAAAGRATGPAPAP